MNLEKWKKVREKGENRFIWVNGCLGWGVTSAVLFFAFRQLTDPVESIWGKPLVSLVLFPIVGVAWGYFVWRISEAKYKKLSRVD